MGNVLYPSFSSLSSLPHNGLSCPLCFAVRRFPVVPLGLLLGFCLDTSLRASGICPNKSNTRTHTRWRGVGWTRGYPLSVLPRESNALSESLSYLGVDGLWTCTCRQRTMSFLYLGSSNQCFEAVTHPVQACHAVGFWGFYLSSCDTCMTTALNVVWRRKSEYSQRGEVEQEQEGKRTEEECGVKKWYSCLFSHSCCSSSHTHRDNETLFCDCQIERKKTKR